MAIQIKGGGDPIWREGTVTKQPVTKAPKRVTKGKTGRPRSHATNAAKQKAYRARKAQR